MKPKKIQTLLIIVLIITTFLTSCKPSSNNSTTINNSVISEEVSKSSSKSSSSKATVSKSESLNSGRENASSIDNSAPKLTLYTPPDESKMESRYHKIIDAKDNGGVVALGVSYVENSHNALIEKFDSNMKLEKSIKLKGVAFNNIIHSIDGGYIISSEESSESFLCKYDSQLNLIWKKNISLNAQTTYIAKKVAQLKNGDIILFRGMGDPQSIQYELTVFDANGNLKKICEKYSSVPVKDISDFLQNPDGSIFVFWNNQKNISLQKFSSDYVMQWEKTFGSSAPSFFEKSCIDSKGNIYVTVATSKLDGDFGGFSTVTEDLVRLLVKMDQNGNILYKTILCDRAPAVPLIGGIKVVNDMAIVTGWSYYNDNYLSKYPCKYLSKADMASKQGDVHFTAVINKDGTVKDIKVFPYGRMMGATNAVAFLGKNTIVIPGGFYGDGRKYNNTYNRMEITKALFVYTDFPI